MGEASRETQILSAIVNDEEYDKTPQSRNEEILTSILKEEEYTKTPQSREEELLLQLKEKIENSSGGGSSFDPLDIAEKETATSTITVS